MLSISLLGGRVHYPYHNHYQSRCVDAHVAAFSLVFSSNFLKNHNYINQYHTMICIYIYVSLYFFQKNLFIIDIIYNQESQ